MGKESIEHGCQNLESPRAGTNGLCRKLKSISPKNLLYQKKFAKVGVALELFVGLSGFLQRKCFGYGDGDCVVLKQR